MRAPISLFCAIALAALAQAAAVASGPDADAPEMAVLPNGVFRPLYRAAGSPEVTPVKSFALDVLPVTNEDFLKFVTAHPEWRRSRASRAAADESYLKDWAEDLRPGDKAPLDAPVTYVSLDAATACAQWRGKRLPTLAEWEYAASASPTRADGQNDAAFKREVLRWYSTPAPAILPPAG